MLQTRGRPHPRLRRRRFIPPPPPLPLPTKVRQPLHRTRSPHSIQRYTFLNSFLFTWKTYKRRPPFQSSRDAADAPSLQQLLLLAKTSRNKRQARVTEEGGRAHPSTWTVFSRTSGAGGLKGGQNACDQAMDRQCAPRHRNSSIRPLQMNQVKSI